MPTLNIRKYSNRRYYDTSQSQHITLEEIHAKICAGHDISVTDNKTGADITAKVLAQILLEHEPTKLDFFPIPLLLQMIRTNEKLLGEFVEKYFNQAFQAFLLSQQQFESLVRQTHGLFPQFNPFGSWIAPPLSSENQDTPLSTTDMQTIVDNLQNQVSSLQEQLKDRIEKH